MGSELLDTYGNARDRIVESLRLLGDLAARRGADQVAISAYDAEQRLRENKFNLVVLGEFKRGKSTLVNCLLGHEILPTAVVPLTSVVTIIGYGDKEKVTVCYDDGREETATAADLPAYITEAGNPGNRKRVARVEADLPLPLLRDGLQIVDTPGVGSVYEHNTRVAHEFLPNADAAVFLVTADPPMSLAERGFLGQVKQHVSKIFVVQNKTDRLSERETDESLRFNKELIEGELGAGFVNVYPVSAKLGLEGKMSGDARMIEESNMPAFEEALSAFLMKERGRVALLSGINGTMRIASELLTRMNLERMAVEMPLQELEERLRLFQQRLTGVRERKEEDLYLLRRFLAESVTSRLDSDLAELKAAQKKLLRRRLVCVGAESARGSGADMLTRINEAMPRFVEEVLSAWQEEEAETISHLLDEKLQPYTDKVNALIDEVCRISEDVFEVRLERFRPDQKLGGQSRLLVRTWSIRVSFELAAMPLLYLMPGRWVRGYILRAAWRRLWEQFDIHCGQARYDLVQRAEASIRDYAKVLDAKVEDTARGIESAVRKAMTERANGQAAVDAALGRLDTELKVVDETLAQMAELRDGLTAASPALRQPAVSDQMQDRGERSCEDED